MKIILTKRGDFMDIYYVDEKKRTYIGSGSWALVTTALYFYRAEGLSVEMEE